MGSGDWNDGMNLVGNHGKGESVWLAFFLCNVLVEFAKVARLRGDVAFADRCEKEAMLLGQRIEYNAWDGEWYRRAYFDDGTPLGSSTNAECQIDSIAQSWSVLSVAGDVGRSRKAMDAVHRRLVRRDSKLIQLLDPPFDAVAARSRVHSRLRPRSAGKRRTVHPCRDLGGDGVRGVGRQRARVGTDRNDQPGEPRPNREGRATYMVEPYVVAADVYALAPHTGRGGWTWYTGSAGWMYRLVVESLLGLNLEADRLRLAPCLPPEWNGFSVRYRYRETLYHIVVSRSESTGDGHPEAMTVAVDGIVQASNVVLLADDRLDHRVEVRVAAGRPAPATAST